jgi:hypothetical protein
MHVDGIMRFRMEIWTRMTPRDEFKDVFMISIYMSMDMDDTMI